MESVERVETAAQLHRLGSDIRLCPIGGPELYLRTELAKRVVSLVSSGANVLLRGAPGVGKTAFVRSLVMADWSREPREPGQLRLIETKPSSAPCIIETDPARFVEGCYYTSNLENKLATVLETARVKPAVLFIDRFEGVLGMGSSSNDPESDVASLLVPHLEKGLCVIGATTADGEARLRSRNPRLLRRFTVVDVAEPTSEETGYIAQLLLHVEKRKGVSVSRGALTAGLDLVARYLPAEPTVSAFGRVLRRAVASGTGVDSSTLRCALVDELGVQPEFVGAAQPRSCTALHAELADEVYGQDTAVGEVVDALARYMAGLVEPGRPVASFLLAGPSGTGKTSLALATARVLTGSTNAIVRFDMSEYSDSLAPRRLLEDSGSSLVGRGLARPAGVLLFDEIEKAHPAVVVLLLQLLGEARLTGENGRTVRFDNFLCLFTSNAGSRRWALRMPAEKTVPLVLADLSEQFPPEFRARLTRTLVFEPLSLEAGARIVGRELDRLNSLPGLLERGLQLVWSDELPVVIASCGVSVESGARGVQSVVRTLVTSPLARWIGDNPVARDGIVTLAPRLDRGRLFSISIDWVDEAGFFRGLAN